MRSFHEYHLLLFFFNATATTEIYTLSLHDALPIWLPASLCARPARREKIFQPRFWLPMTRHSRTRSEEHTSELQSRGHLVCRLLLEKKKEQTQTIGTVHLPQVRAEGRSAGYV